MNASGRINDFDYEPGGCGTQILFIIAIGIVLFLTGCKSVEYVPVVETQYHHDSIYFTNVKFDSIYVHDSVSVKESGDTVRIERWHTKYKEKQVHDTVYQAKTDSVRVPVPYEVEKKLTAKEKIYMKIGEYSIYGIFAIVVLYAIFMRFKRH